RLAIGRIMSGSLTVGQRANRLGVDANGGEICEGFSVTKLFRYSGLSQQEVKSLEAGDVGVIAGTETFEIGDTVGGEPTTPRLKRIEVNKPTLGMIFSVNTSPFSGREGEAVQSRKL